MSNKNNTKPVYTGNSIMLRPDGPLICKSETEITVQTAKEEVIFKNKEFALCRCGLSNTKPLCDGRHKIQGVKISENFTDEREEDISGLTGGLTITVKENAMYSVRGPVIIFSRNGLSKTTRIKAALCRCGHSANMPFCDVSHKKCGFVG